MTRKQNGKPSCAGSSPADVHQSIRSCAGFRDNGYGQPTMIWGDITAATHKRLVKIELRNGAYMVLYVTRQKHGRYSAGQFDARDHTLRDVEEWVSLQKEITL